MWQLLYLKTFNFHNYILLIVVKKIYCNPKSCLLVSFVTFMAFIPQMW